MKSKPMVVSDEKKCLNPTFSHLIINQKDSPLTRADLDSNFFNKEAIAVENLNFKASQLINERKHENETCTREKDLFGKAISSTLI
jgi:hypothetical protein